jgi:CheY-like chemotaxis protein
MAVKALHYYRGKVLLVDDEPLVLEMFESVLRRDGFDVVTATNSPEARECLRKYNFDLLLCDVWLEELDGFAVAEIARERMPQIGVILVTGRPSQKDQEFAESKGYAYLSKPVPFEVLREAVFENIDSKKNAIGELEPSKLPPLFPSKPFSE